MKKRCTEVSQYKVFEEGYLYKQFDKKLVLQLGQYKYAINCDGSGRFNRDICTAVTQLKRSQTKIVYANKDAYEVLTKAMERNPDVTKVQQLMPKVRLRKSVIGFFRNGVLSVARKHQRTTFNNNVSEVERVEDVLAYVKENHIDRIYMVEDDRKAYEEHLKSLRKTFATEKVLQRLERMTYKDKPVL